MFLFGKVLELWGRVFLIDTSFSAKTLDIGKFVDHNLMLLVEGNTIELLAGGGGFSCGRVFNESEPRSD
jgi:hypothetical protein